MDKLRALTAGVSVILLMTVVSSVRADSVHSQKVLANFGLVQTLDLPTMTRAEFRDFLVDQLDASDFGGFLAERFEGNNGLHLGFLKAASKGNHLGVNNQNNFVGNNGKRIGFSVAVFNPGMKYGLVNPRHSSPSVSQNPEPTAMILLGTGLAAVAGLARRKVRRR